MTILQEFLKGPLGPHGPLRGPSPICEGPRLLEKTIGEYRPIYKNPEPIKGLLTHEKEKEKREKIKRDGMVKTKRALNDFGNNVKIEHWGESGPLTRVV